MVKSGDLIAVRLNVQVAKGKVEQRTMYVQKGMEITLDNNSVYTIKNDGVYTNGKKVSDVNLSASEYSIISGIGLTESEGLPENSKDKSFVLTQQDITSAYNARKNDAPKTQAKINNAQWMLDTGESVFMRDAFYKCQPNGIEVTAKSSPGASGGTSVSVFYKK